MFAGYLWDEHAGGPSTFQNAKDVYDAWANDPDYFWARPLPEPGRDTMFDLPVYFRGFMMLAGLRHEMGDTLSLRLLRTWTRTRQYGNVTTAQSTELASQIAGT